jgi:hypothetical protein
MFGDIIMKSRKKLLIISMTILASLILSGFPIMPTGTSASVASLGDDHSEDFEGIVFPSWTATGLWHLEDNSTSSYPIYGWMPSVTRYMSKCYPLYVVWIEYNRNI